MKVRYSPDFYRLYKGVSVIIRKSVDEKIEVFVKDPNDLQLDNHALEREWKGIEVLILQQITVQSTEKSLKGRSV